MLKTDSATGLTGRIQQLLNERQQHVDALACIEQTLSGVAAALGMISSNKQGPVEAIPTKKLGRPLGSRNVAPAATPKKGRRTRGSYATTGDESILAFIKANKNPTTSDVKAHWASEGRLGTADNVLSKLFREKRVKRTPLGKGIRGSRYSLA